ncbi:MAG: sodium:proton exchanger [Salinibacterium sp.]|nr:MAG: sodium:proton exchanger [Salinibacterium sp.]
MTDIEPFALTVLIVASALLLAVFANLVSKWTRVPTPALVLMASAAAAYFVPALGASPLEANQRIVTVALVLILFDGGMHIGLLRLRTAGGAIAWIGVAGTAVTAAGLALVAHFLFGFDWSASLLIGAALAPTDPAVVFSILGKREISGRAGTILEGESGANDPVGIALMVALLAVTGTGWTAVGQGFGEFGLQLAVGAAIGIAGGFLLSAIMRRAPLPNEALYSLRTLAVAGLIYAAATLLHGSGFLAVFIAGIMIGDLRAPYKREVERFSAGMASLAEIIAFTVLGLSIRLEDVVRPDVLWTGLGLAALLIFVIRPVLVGLLIVPIKLRLGERAFVLWAGLKGAVPILLGMFILSAHVPGAERIYAIIFIVVLVSVVLQGGLVPYLATVLRVPMRIVEPRPWTLDLRFNEEPQGLERHIVAPGSPADGSTISELELGDDGWISMVRRSGRLLPVGPNTRLQAGDAVLTLVGGERDLAELFEA